MKFLSGFEFQIVYRSGPENGKAGALSRRPEYRPEEGAQPTKQALLKPGQFQVSLVRATNKPEKTNFDTKVR